MRSRKPKASSAETLRAGEARVLDMVAADEPLDRTLDALARVFEAQADGMLATILLPEDGVRVRHGAAPSLPQEWVRAIDGLGVDLVSANDPTVTRYATEKGDFVWPMEATLAAESLATGKPLLINPEHALHVLEVIQAARESQDTGRRIHLRSSFRRPIVT